MSYSTLKQKLSNVKEPNLQFWANFELHLYETDYNKNDIWLKEGKKGKKIGLIVNGGAKSFTMKDGVKQLDRLWQPNSLLLPPSVFTDSNSECSIQFTTYSQITQFSIEAIDKLRPVYGDIAFYIDHFLGIELRAYMNHIRWIKYNTAKQLHHDAVLKYGNLYQDLPNHEKGSFIGVGEKRIRDIIKE